MKRGSDAVMPSFRHDQVEADNRAWVLGKAKRLAYDVAVFLLGAAVAVAAPWVLALAGATGLGGR
jgi:hypothetical protein